MTASQIPLFFYLFFVCEFVVEAIVGMSVLKKSNSALVGMAVALLLALVLIAYMTTLDLLINNRLASFLDIFRGTIAFLIFFFPISSLCLLAAIAGYWTAFLTSWPFGIGRSRVSLGSIFSLIAVLAAAAALVGQLKP